MGILYIFFVNNFHRGRDEGGTFASLVIERSGWRKLLVLNDPPDFPAKIFERSSRKVTIPCLCFFP